MVTLVVAEKPSMARDIAAVLGARQRREGFLAGGQLGGDEVWVTWCVGHLVEVAEPHEHDPRWKRWNPALLPMLPDELQLRARARSR